MAATKTMTRDEQRRATRRRIVDAARDCFYQEGVAETSMEQIARVAGIGRATLYLHFTSKDAVLLEILTQNLSVVRRIFASLGSKADLASIGHWLLSYIETLRTHRDDTRLVQIGTATNVEARHLIRNHHELVAEALVARFPELSDGTVRGQTRLLLLIARIDHFANAAAETPPFIDVEQGVDLVAREILSMLDGQRD